MLVSVTSDRPEQMVWKEHAEVTIEIVRFEDSVVTTVLEWFVYMLVNCTVSGIYCIDFLDCAWSWCDVCKLKPVEGFSVQLSGSSAWSGTNQLIPRKVI
jgi:hypothetical protein